MPPPRAPDERPSLWCSLLDGLDDGVCLIRIVCDEASRPVDYRFLHVNPAFAQHTGLVDAVGRTVREMVPDIEQIWIETYGAVALGGEPVRLEHRSESLDGGWFEVKAWRIGEPAERLVAVSFRNVKERKLAEDEREELLRAVQTERQRLAEVLALSPSFAAVFGGPEHRFLATNERLLDLIGERNAIGRTVAEVVPEAAEQGFTALLDQVFSSGVPYVGNGDRFARRRRDGQPGFEDRFIDQVYQPSRDAQGRITGVIAQGIDVTERKLAADALHEADRRKDEFLATLAHELRNPLAPLVSALAVLDRMAATATAQGGEPPAATAARETMRRQMHQMVRLIDDLLDVSRITRGVIDLRKQRVELGAVVLQAVESVDPVLQAANQRLAKALPAEPVWLKADPARLVQVLGNLLANASRYSPAGAMVRIAAERVGDDVAISVEDSGVGIPADRLESIFEIFTQLPSPLSRSAGGLGIGLYLVQRLVQLHGGTVQAFSGGPGQGSRFVLHLPAMAPDPAALPVAASSLSPVPPMPPVPPIGAYRVLIADDNVDAAHAMAQLLELDGHTTCTAADGLQAVEAAMTFVPEIVVLDIGMPGIDGYEACRRIRRLPGSERLTIVALTGWGQQNDKRQSREAGFDGHLVKPVQADELMVMIAGLLKR